MMFLHALLCLHLFSTLSAADKALLERVSPAVWLQTDGDEYLHTRRFERMFPRSRVPDWQRLQTLVDLLRMEYSDLTCLLAYYGVDYKANLRRLLSVYWLCRRDPKRYYVRFQTGSFGNKFDTKYVPGYLKLLYHKTGDAQTLGLLLDLQWRKARLRKPTPTR